MSGDVLAKEFGRALTREVAAEELPFYDELLDAADRPPRKAKDHSLGFGVEAILASGVSAALFQIGKLALVFIWDNAKDSVGTFIKDLTAEGSNYVTKRFAKWVEGGLRGPAPVALTQESLNELVQIVDEKSIQLHVSDEDRAKLRETFKHSFEVKPL